MGDDDLVSNYPDLPEQTINLIATGRRTDAYANVVDDITRLNGKGSLKSAMASAFWGHNYIGTPMPLHLDHDQYGLVFFTKPRLNLSYDNVVRERTFTHLVNNDKKSVATVIRSCLDPVGASFRNECSDYIDPNSAFLHILSNTLVTLSGFPDPVVDTYTSKSGIYREEFGFIDGFAKNFSKFQLSSTFRGTIGKPVLYMLHYWSQYGALVHEGKLDPYPEAIFENEIDYQSRIYRFNLDSSRTYVTGVTSVAAAFPIANNLGALADYDSSKTIMDQTDTFSVNWECYGIEYLDEIIYQEFNDVVCIFNPKMIDTHREQYYRKLTVKERQWFNAVGYPRINMDTKEFEIWVSNEEYDEVMKIGKQYGYY